MTIEDKLYSRMTATEGTLYPLAALRVYPTLRPQDSGLPAVTWQRIATTPTHAFGTDANLFEARLQVDCWAETHDAAREVSAAVRERLSRWRDDANDVLDCLLENDTDLFEEDAEMHRVLLEFRLCYRE